MIPQNESSTDSIQSQMSESKNPSALFKALEAYLSANVDARYNTVTERTEVKMKTQKVFVPITDQFLNDLWISCHQNKLSVHISSIARLLNSSFAARYDPFDQYLQQLPAWDMETDYIQQLADSVTTPHKAYWDKWLRKWIVAVVGSLIEESAVNHQVLILQGQQGIGKSTWFAKLIPNSLKQYYYSGKIDLKNKDTLTYLSQCMLINLDELANINRFESDALKEIITKGSISLRKPYDRYNTFMPRRASFVGSVNNPTFLADPTGSRRFLPIEATHIEYNHSVDMNLVFAQALQLYMDGFPYYFNDEEQREVEEHNKQFTVECVEDTLLPKYFEVATDGEETNTLTTTEIVEYISKATNGRVPLNTRSLQRFGKSLIRYGFIRVKHKGTYKYLVKKVPRCIDFRNARS